MPELAKLSCMHGLAKAQLKRFLYAHCYWMIERYNVSRIYRCSEAHNPSKVFSTPLSGGPRFSTTLECGITLKQARSMGFYLGVAHLV